VSFDAGALLSPVRLSAQPARFPGPAPVLGRHTAALLARRGHVVPADQLLEILWPDDDPHTTRRHEIYGDEVLVTTFT